MINLTGCTRVITREPIKGHRSVFDVCTADRVYHLAAESVAEKAEWIHTLNRLLFTDKVIGSIYIISGFCSSCEDSQAFHF